VEVANCVRDVIATKTSSRWWQERRSAASQRE
jgi:hypothetical protein